MSISWKNNQWEDCGCSGQTNKGKVILPDNAVGIKWTNPVDVSPYINYEEVVGNSGKKYRFYPPSWNAIAIDVLSEDAKEFVENGKAVLHSDENAINGQMGYRAIQNA